MGDRNPLGELRERLAAGRTRYLRDQQAGRVGNEVHSRSGKDLPPHRPRCEVDPEKVAELPCQGLSWRAVAERLGISVGTARRAWGVSQHHPAPENLTTACQKIAPSALPAGVGTNRA